MSLSRAWWFAATQIELRCPGRHCAYRSWSRRASAPRCDCDSAPLGSSFYFVRLLCRCRFVVGSVCEGMVAARSSHCLCAAMPCRALRAWRAVVCRGSRCALYRAPLGCVHVFAVVCGRLPWLAWARGGLRCSGRCRGFPCCVGSVLSLESATVVGRIGAQRRR